ncbi:hypothetical protein VTK56DRAFT_5293 [Thermocarpiscus australiensis]
MDAALELADADAGADVDVQRGDVEMTRLVLALGAPTPSRQDGLDDGAARCVGGRDKPDQEMGKNEQQQQLLLDCLLEASADPRGPSHRRADGAGGGCAPGQCGRGAEAARQGGADPNDMRTTLPSLYYAIGAASPEAVEALIEGGTDVKVYYGLGREG